MAYTPNELRLLVGGFMSNVGGPNIWSYDTTDAINTVNDANYISDANARGMRAGDIVITRVFASLTAKGTPTAVSLMAVLTVGASGANLADGTAIVVTDAA